MPRLILIGLLLVALTGCAGAFKSPLQLDWRGDLGVRSALPPAQQRSDALIITPDLSGMIALPDLNGMLWLGYGAVQSPTRLTITTYDDGLRFQFEPPISHTRNPLLIETNHAIYITDQAGTVQPIRGTDDYLIYYDLIGFFAQSVQQPDHQFLMGAVENYHPSMTERQHPRWQAQVIEYQHQTYLEVTDQAGGRLRLPLARSIPRYRAGFAGQNAGHPATLGLLGWVTGADLVGMVRSMSLAFNHQALPLVGSVAPFDLWLPFDCEHDWLVSWGFHEGTSQNRYAVDFASAEGAGMAQGLPIRAAHAGILDLKIYGVDGQALDLGLAARIRLDDGSTALVYGHLDPQTLAMWNLSPDDAGAFEWIEVGQVSAGEVIGLVGTSGYSMGPHIHIVLWTGNQSIYRPIFDGLDRFERGLLLPGDLRSGCERYVAYP